MGFIENIAKLVSGNDDLFEEEFEDDYQAKWNNIYLGFPRIDKDQEVLDKLKIGEMLNVEEMKILVEITLTEFKKTFGNVEDEMEVVFRKKKEKVIDTKENKKTSKKEKGEKEDDR